MSDRLRFRVYLECRQGTSNKGYEIAVRGEDNACSLTTLHGPIWAVTARGVHFDGTWDRMERKARTLVKEKERKGYTVVDRGGDIHPPLSEPQHAKRDMDATPPSMQPDVTAAPDRRDAMLADRANIMQVLVPGQRCALRLGPGAAALSAPTGAVVAVPRVVRGHLPTAFARMPTATLDCVLTADKVLWVYDIYTINNTAPLGHMFTDRLHTLVEGVQETDRVRLAPGYTLPGGKQAAAATAPAEARLVFTNAAAGAVTRAIADVPAREAGVVSVGAVSMRVCM